MDAGEQHTEYREQWLDSAWALLIKEALLAFGKAEIVVYVVASVSCGTSAQLGVWAGVVWTMSGAQSCSST